MWSHSLFNRKNEKTFDFSESFVACDLKVCRHRQLIELIKLCEYSRSMSFFVKDQF